MRKKVSLFIIFILSFVALVLLFSKGWVLRKFGGDITLNQVLFHLYFPLDGVDSNLTSSFIKNVILTSVAIALCITFSPQILSFLQYRALPNIKAFIKNHTLFSQFSLCFVLLIIAFITLNKKFKIIEYVKSNLHKEYSTFYEENYVFYNKDSQQDSKKPNNLIVIFIESMESTFSSKNIPLILSSSELEKLNTYNAGGGGGG